MKKVNVVDSDNMPGLQMSTLQYYRKSEFIFVLYNIEKDGMLKPTTLSVSCREELNKIVSDKIYSTTGYDKERTKVMVIIGSEIASENLIYECINTVIDVLNKIEKECRLIKTTVVEALPFGKPHKSAKLFAFTGSSKWISSPFLFTAYTGIMRLIFNICVKASLNSPLLRNKLKKAKTTLEIGRILQQYRLPYKDTPSSAISQDIGDYFTRNNFSNIVLVVKNRATIFKGYGTGSLYSNFVHYKGIEWLLNSNNGTFGASESMGSEIVKRINDIRNKYCNDKEDK